MHAHAGDERTTKVLQVALLVTAAYIGLLVVAGVRAHSLALLSEAGHNLADFVALLFSLVAVYLHGRPPSATHTYGYHRAGVLAALANAATLGAIALMLYRTNRDVNVRSALLHEIGDTLSTAAVIAGGWAILVTGQLWIDSALSLGIGALILWSSFGIMRETLNILLEGTPRGMKLARVEACIREIDGVNDVHDLHVWSIGSETSALSCHISIADIPPSASER